MKVGLIGICLLACALSFGQAAAQSKPSVTRLTFQDAMALEDPAERIAALQQILRSRPAHEQADEMREAIVASWAQLGESQLSENNIEKAAVNFRKALAALPERVTDKFFEETVIRIPLAVSVRGYREEAAGLARLMEKRFAKEATRLAALGEFFMTIEAPVDAIRALESAAKLSEDEARLHRALGAAYRMGLRLDDAVAEYQLAIGADPNDRRAYYELANLYRAHGAYADAAKLYLKQLEIEPKHTPSLKGLALSHLAQGDEEQMTAALNKARDLRGSAEEITGDLYLQTQMAFYYLSQNKQKQARVAGEAALMIEPRYAWARIAVAEVDLAEGKIFEAERNLLAAERYASFPTLFFTFGKLYLAVEDFDGAVERFSKAFSVANNSAKDLYTTRLGGSLDVKAESVKELLAREHQAAIFIANAPTQPEQFKMAESLVRFHTWLGEIKKITASGKGTVTRKQMEELDRGVMDFVEVESTRRSYRGLYVAQKLAQAGIATGLAVELAEQALGLAEVATELDGSLKDYPNYDRNGRLQIFRGRALDAKGWALFKAGQNQEAVAALEEAVKAYGTLPEGKQAMWHLASVKEIDGDLGAALDLYIAGYEPPEVAGGADVKLALIEVLYKKVNGSPNGLGERLQRAGIVASVETNTQTAAPSKQQLSKSRETSRSGKSQPKPTRTLRASEEAKRKSEERKSDLAGAPLPTVNDPANPETTAPTNPDVPKEKRSEPATAALNVSAKERLNEGASEAEKVEVKKEEGSNAEAAPIVVKPVELPVINPTVDQSMVPLLSPMEFLSQLEGISPDLTPSAEIEIPPPPTPAPKYTRPRRVAVPATRPRVNNQ